MRRPFWARIYATTTFSSRQCDANYPHLTGGLCWRHPRPTFRRQRLVWARDYDTSSRTIASESSSPRKRHRPPSSRMHRSRDGEPLSFQTPATLKLPEGKWKRKPFLIMQTETRAVRLALLSFSAILPFTMDIWVDNTSLRGAADKGSSKPHAMTWELKRIYEFLTFAKYRHPLSTCGLRKTAQTEYHAVVFLNFRNWRRAAAESCGWRKPKSATS
ncbi:putative target of rapamycin (TOR) kinase 1 [Trypanosoma cruzi]|uniref:Putative target of rapamycin (TOR) kinase 1 n=1 Tax=Trypanosoma cruzi TaxID=5693 RepID=A0A2V2WF06_TRYCR|nr:putative target of rapamycin (TOR) kinase 1 [Trypanosoma cruzi]